jgi:hypothetical protein
MDVSTERVDRRDGKEDKYTKTALSMPADKRRRLKTKVRF